jgi:predicted dehydrogenase
MNSHNNLGLAIIGSGRIGTLRSTIAAAHSAVRFIAVADKDPGRAKALSDKVGAQFHTSDNLAAMSHPEVNAIIVSTIEMQHTEPVLQALELGKPVLVEKPIAVDLESADRIVAAAAKSKAGLHVGYSRRFKERYLIAKEQIVQGRLGRITGTAARVYNSRSQAMQTLARMPADANPVSGLTYYIDLMNWLLRAARRYRRERSQRVRHGRRAAHVCRRRDLHDGRELRAASEISCAGTCGARGSAGQRRRHGAR